MASLQTTGLDPTPVPFRNGPIIAVVMLVVGVW